MEVDFKSCVNRTTWALRWGRALVASGGLLLGLLAATVPGQAADNGTADAMTVDEAVKLGEEFGVVVGDVDEEIQKELKLQRPQARRVRRDEAVSAVSAADRRSWDIHAVTRSRSRPTAPPGASPWLKGKGQGRTRRSRLLRRVRNSSGSPRPTRQPIPHPGRFGDCGSTRRLQRSRRVVSGTER